MKMHFRHNILAAAPDDYQIEMLTINGSMPGPLIEANWGDDLVIHVTNNHPDNGYGTLSDSRCIGGNRALIKLRDFELRFTGTEFTKRKPH